MGADDYQDRGRERQAREGVLRVAVEERHAGLELGDQAEGLVDPLTTALGKARPAGHRVDGGEGRRELLPHRRGGLQRPRSG